jgi:hypothetical protein
MLLASSGSSSWYSEPRNLGALLKLLAYPVAFLVAGIAGWWHKHKEKIALNWPSIEGRVQFASVAPIQDSSSYSATLQYSYFVGEYRSGEYTEIFDSENGADKFVEMMKDQKVPVRYNPKDADDSLVEEADVEQYAPLPSPIRLTPLK